jgi:hypothetical protein
VSGVRAHDLLQIGVGVAGLGIAGTMYLMRGGNGQ